MSKNNEKNIKFDFGTKAQEETVESVESKELSDVEAVETPADLAELTDSTSETAENNAETTEEADAEKAVVSYIGNGVWRDAKGKHWSRNERKDANILSTRSYNKSEYDEREDLKFMVKYGEMKVSLV